jgi:hypothetical protein
MNSKLTILVAAAAGFAGGLASRYAAPPVVHAQTASPQPQVIRAQKFVVVDAKGAVVGAFGLETNGTAQIEVKDPKGHVCWYNAVVPMGLHTMTDGGNLLPKKPSLLTP